MTNAKNKKLIKIGFWALSNLCRGVPLPSYELVKDAVQPLCKALIIEEDSAVLTDCSWAISYTCNSDQECI